MVFVIEFCGMKSIYSTSACMQVPDEHRCIYYFPALVPGVERLHVRSLHPLHVQCTNSDSRFIRALSRLTSPAGDLSIPSAMFIHGGHEEQSTELVQVELSVPPVTAMTTPMPHHCHALHVPARLVTVTPLQPAYRRQLWCDS